MPGETAYRKAQRAVNRMALAGGRDLLTIDAYEIDQENENVLMVFILSWLIVFVLAVVLKDLMRSVPSHSR